MLMLQMKSNTLIFMHSTTALRNMAMSTIKKIQIFVSNETVMDTSILHYKN